MIAKKRFYNLIKRILDIVLSACLIIFLSFPMLLIYAAVRLSSRGEAIFRQKRVGKDGRIFTCYKFRTMYRYSPNNVPTSSFLGAERYITPVGRVLRKTSLDELPQLFNVFKGDMSLVGPRPLIENEGEIHLLRKRCGVYRIRPGITGLAQINGRDGVGDIEKARYDAKYARTMGLVQDTKIIFGTLGIALQGKGVAH